MLQAFPKPKDLEGLITLTPKQRAEKRRELFFSQKGICAECLTGMALGDGSGLWDATLDHIIVQPMGHKKNDRDDNLRAVHLKCNTLKGSKRP